MHLKFWNTSDPRYISSEFWDWPLALRQLLTYDRGNYGKIEDAWNPIFAYRTISIVWWEVVCEIFLKKIHHMPVFWRTEDGYFLGTGIVGGFLLGKSVGKGIFDVFWVSGTLCTPYESPESISMPTTTLGWVYFTIYGPSTTLNGHNNPSSPLEPTPQSPTLYPSSSTDTCYALQESLSKSSNSSPRASMFVSHPPNSLPIFVPSFCIEQHTSFLPPTDMTSSRGREDPKKSSQASSLCPLHYMQNLACPPE